MSSLSGEFHHGLANVVGVGATTVFKVARIKREHPERIKEIEDDGQPRFQARTQVGEPIQS